MIDLAQQRKVRAFIDLFLENRDHDLADNIFGKTIIVLRHLRHMIRFCQHLQLRVNNKSVRAILIDPQIKILEFMKKFKSKEDLPGIQQTQDQLKQQSLFSLLRDTYQPIIKDKLHSMAPKLI